MGLGVDPLVVVCKWRMFNKNINGFRELFSLTFQGVSKISNPL